MKKSVLWLLFAGLLLPLVAAADIPSSRNLEIYIDTGSEKMREEPGSDPIYKEVASQLRNRLAELIKNDKAKKTNVKVFAVAKHRDRQTLDTSRLLLNVVAGQKPDFKI